MHCAGLDFSNLQLVRLLDGNERFKYAALLVKMSSEQCPEPVDTVILAEKTSFDSGSAVGDMLFGSAPASESGVSLSLIDHNDIYYRAMAKFGDTPFCKLTVIHPATAKHIAKYTRQERLLVQETPALYQSVVEPYISANPASRLQWVQNILEERSEMDSLVYADRDPATGFYLLPDSKWDRRNLAGIYLLAIAKNPAIRSLRDLEGSKHLELLKGIRRAVFEEVPRCYPGVTGAQLRCFIHYQPTYYHFHVHVVHVDMIDGIGALVGQAHLLDEVIDNLQLVPDFYRRKTLTYQLGRNHELFTSLSQ